MEVPFNRASLDSGEAATRCAALLVDDARRTAIADAGHAFAFALPLSESIARIIELAEGRSERPATPPSARR